METRRPVKPPKGRLLRCPVNGQTAGRTSEDEDEDICFTRSMSHKRNTSMETKLLDTIEKGLIEDLVQEHSQRTDDSRFQVGAHQ